MNPSDTPDAAIAMIDAEGTVVGWTQAARQLVGYSARDVVGRSAAHVLQSCDDATRVTSLAEQCRVQGGWSGTMAVRHRDGHTLTLTLRVSLLWGENGSHRWLVSRTSHPRLRHPGALDENGRGLFLIAHLSRRWGSRSASDGKVVWAEQDLSPTAVAR
ncbi:PAS domain S-box protein [Streptomyces sp. NPDC004546]|uniref:PAS domain S-box protein n=1 Tax=Streptomyces sp. NPDC004546 TaxID=3154282 RepID=UPI0033AABFBB